MELQSTSQNNTLKNARTWILIAIGLIILVLSILTLLELWNRLNYFQTSSVGETIGGICSPIVGLLTAILLFYALMEQVKANSLAQLQIMNHQNKELLQNESAEIHRLYNSLTGIIDRFSYCSLKSEEFGSKPYLQGSEAIYKLFEDLYYNDHLTPEELSSHPKITELKSMLEICNAILERLKTSTIAEKEALTVLTKHQLRYRICPQLHPSDNSRGLPSDIVVLIKNLDV